MTNETARPTESAPMRIASSHPPKNSFRPNSMPSTAFRQQLSLMIATVISSLLFGASVVADDPLHVRIDQRLAELHSGPEVPLCSDGEFMRRVYLDFVGTIPPSAEARKFIADAAADKRAKLIEQLLSSSEHASHMANVFDVMLMERRADKYVKAPEWQGYLLTSFEQNKPYNELAREILAADSADEKKRAAAKFYLEREVEANLITREVGRMFFGMDVQCAQCHDHPVISDYYQSDYYGIFAFVNRTYLFQPDKKKPALLAEKAEGDAKFKSVFTGNEGATRPRLPGSVEIDEPTFAKTDAYQVKPDPKKKTIRPIPKYSRREKLAELATNGSNRVFNRNIVNRIWAHMIGRGLVHPVDGHYSDNPPAHPQLLDMLADDFVSMKFDIKSLLRELALSKAYQRSVDLPNDLLPHAGLAKQQIPNLQKKLQEVKTILETSPTAVGELEKQLKVAKAKLSPLREAEKKAVDALAAAKKPVDDNKKALAETQTALTAKQAVAKPLGEAVAKATVAAATLKEDQKLAQAIKLLQTQQQKLNSEVAQLTKKLTGLTAAMPAAQKKLADAQATADTAA